jgi:spore maturation protein CgeB
MKAIQPEKTFHFLMERPLTPIYERINRAFKDALEELGHRVTYFDHTQFENYQEALKYFFKNIASQVIDYCLITSNSQVFYSYFQDAEKYLFELMEGQLIFIHHDDIAQNFIWKRDFVSTLQSWQRVKDRSIHFCLESTNVSDLRLMGFEQVYNIVHGSEFKYIKPPKEYFYTLSFVGHLLPELGEEFKLFPYAHLFQADFWNRLIKLDTKFKASAISFSKKMQNIDNNSNFFEQKFFYIAAMNLVSPCFRGELFKRLKNIEMDIFGGDPSYLHGTSSNKIIENEYIKYHPPSADYLETQYIYANSKINLNVTSLQFDDAVVNRVIDVGAVGGFILTDWKPDLQNITSVSNEISYQTIDELNYKINYYLAHEEERIKLADKLHQDIINKCTYFHVVKFLLSKIS